MGTLVTGLLGFFLHTAIGRVLGLALAACIALTLWTNFVTHGAKQTAEIKIVGKVQQAAETETERRLKAIETAQAASSKEVARLIDLQQRNTKLLERIDDASRRHDGDACLAADGVRRLDAIR